MDRVWVANTTTEDTGTLARSFKYKQNKLKKLNLVKFGGVCIWHPNLLKSKLYRHKIGTKNYPFITIMKVPFPVALCFNCKTTKGNILMENIFCWKRHSSQCCFQKNKVRQQNPLQSRTKMQLFEKHSQQEQYKSFGQRERRKILKRKVACMACMLRHVHLLSSSIIFLLSFNQTSFSNSPFSLSLYILPHSQLKKKMQYQQ